MKLYGAVLALSALVLAVAAYSGSNLEDFNVAAVDRAIRQYSAAFVNYVYAIAGQPQPDGSSEVIQELIAASVPESIRQDVADELEVDGDGALSGELQKRMNQHILEWSLQHVPEDLRRDIIAVLDEGRVTGQISSNREQMTERIKQYITSSGDGRDKQEFWSGLLFLNYFLKWLVIQ